MKSVGKTKFNIFLLITLLSASNIVFGLQKGLSVNGVDDKSEFIHYQKSYALLIGVSNYANGWPDLESIPNELDKLEASLTNKGFEVVRISNPNSKELKTSYADFLEKYGYDENNRLLFFYSGHGHTMNDGSKGYLVPTDAPHPDDDPKNFKRKALDMTQILAWARQMEAKHGLFLFDSCFSGTIFKQKRLLPKNVPQIDRWTSRPVRQFITAGSAGESVPARSTFTPAVIDAIEGRADLNKDGYVIGTELGLFLQSELPRYVQQTPQYGKINDYSLSRGEFVFFTPQRKVVVSNLATSPAAPAIPTSELVTELATKPEATPKSKPAPAVAAVIPSSPPVSSIKSSNPALIASTATQASINNYEINSSYLTGSYVEDSDKDRRNYELTGYSLDLTYNFNNFSTMSPFFSFSRLQKLDFGFSQYKVEETVGVLDEFRAASSRTDTDTYDALYIGLSFAIIDGYSLSSSLKRVNGFGDNFNAYAIQLTRNLAEDKNLKLKYTRITLNNSNNNTATKWDVVYRQEFPVLSKLTFIPNFTYWSFGSDSSDSTSNTIGILTSIQRNKFIWFGKFIYVSEAIDNEESGSGYQLGTRYAHNAKISIGLNYASYSDYWPFEKGAYVFQSASSFSVNAQWIL